MAAMHMIANITAQCDSATKYAISQNLLLMSLSIEKELSTLQ
jgi:hypothetical protein